MKSILTILLLLTLLFPAHCMEAELALTGTNAEKEQEQNDELKFNMFLAMVVGFYNQTCESLAYNNIVNLTQGVSSGPFTERTCFIVSTSGPATIQVTTSGVGETSILSYTNNVSSKVPITDDPSTSIPFAMESVKFVVPGIDSPENFTVLVN